MDRKLASIQTITSLTPIPEAQKIEKAVVLGWEVVVNKGDFKVGDKCCYVEIDSILPDKPEFEFLRECKFRIRTIRLKGQVSQGICFPLSILPAGKLYFDGDGYDVTDLIGVKKYDPQAEAERKEMERLDQIKKGRLRKFFMRYPWYRRRVFKPAKLPFPAWIKKTDEDRIQLFPNICTDYKDESFMVTEKIDGQSGTFFVIRNNSKLPWAKKWLFGVCSRNFQILKPDGQSYIDVAKKYDIEKILIKNATLYNFSSLVIQGEIIGPKIQGNKYGVDCNHLYLFNVIGDGNPGTPEDVEKIAEFMGLKSVPVLSTHFILPDCISKVVDTAKGVSLLANIPREGIVIRSKGFSCKVINPDFLLKYDA